MTEELLTVEEVAQRLKVNQQTVRNWIDRGELTGTRLGARRVRVTDSDLNRFLKLKEQAQTAVTARPAPSRRRRATASDVQAVEVLIESMLTTAADLPLGSPSGLWIVATSCSYGLRPLNCRVSISGTH